MTINTCTYLQSWLLNKLPYEPSTQEKQDLQAHLMDCAECQRFLYSIASEIIQIPEVPEVDCDVCSEHLAAFIDLVELNAYQALQKYPAIWWHIVSCPMCAEVYTLTTELVEAEAHNQIVIPRYSEEAVPNLWQRFSTLLQISWDDLSDCFMPMLSSVTRSAKSSVSQSFNYSGSRAIYHRKVDDHRFTVKASVIENDVVGISIESVPFYDKPLMVMVGDEQYESIIQEFTEDDETIMAHIACIPAERFTSGNEISLTIQHVS